MCSRWECHMHETNTENSRHLLNHLPYCWQAGMAEDDPRLAWQRRNVEQLDKSSKQEAADKKKAIEEGKATRDKLIEVRSKYIRHVYCAMVFLVDWRCGVPICAMWHWAFCRFHASLWCSV